MIPRSHPRYMSLMTREKIVQGVEAGITSLHGLIAQGRGEAFDYLLGEVTTQGALGSERAAAAMLLQAEHPVISVNGNTAALVPDEIAALGKLVHAPIEVNLFHRTEERVQRIITHMRAHGALDICNKADARIPGIEHDRAIADSDGIFRADVVLVPLEDGDRCGALADMGKRVIAIDLNPFSRTSQLATISIVDNIVRAIPNITGFAEELASFGKASLQAVVERYDNTRSLRDAGNEMRKRLGNCNIPVK